MHMCVFLVKSLCLFDYYYIYIYLHTSGIYNYICHMYVYNYIYIHAVLLITVISHCGSIISLAHVHLFCCMGSVCPRRNSAQFLASDSDTSHSADSEGEWELVPTRAVLNWRRLGRKVRRWLRLRRLWASLGHYLRRSRSASH